MSKDKFKSSTGFRKFEIACYDSKIYLDLIKTNEIKLHPKNEFINNLKCCGTDMKNKKIILARLRQFLFEQVVCIYYDEVDVYLVQTNYITKIIDDIHILSTN